MLGRRTAECISALATPTDDSAFAAEPFTPEDLARDARRIDTQIVAALDALKAKFLVLRTHCGRGGAAAVAAARAHPAGACD